MADITLNIIQELRRENEALRRELCERTIERDEWKDKAVDLSHINTQMSHHSNEPNVYHMQDYPATKLTGDTTPAVSADRII